MTFSRQVSDDSEESDATDDDGDIELKTKGGRAKAAAAPAKRSQVWVQLINPCID
jgi:hypothetical protein